MRLSLRACAFVVALAIGLTMGRVGAQSGADGDLEQMLARATQYSLDFVNKLSQVVSEEHYLQDSSVSLPTVPIPGGGGRGGSAVTSSSVSRNSAKHRELKADFLLVKTAGDQLTPFRDVFEVDHVPVRDRDQRLAKLFLKNNADSTDERARAITEESARYNLGAVERTINNPVFALAFLRSELRARVKFTAGKPDRAAGDGVRVVNYVEEGRPTVIVGPNGQDMPAFGRFWIEAATGRIVKAEVRVDVKEIRANLTTTFHTDGRLGIDVPAEFHEDYDMPAARLTAVADYSRFRRFEVTSTEEFEPPAGKTPDPKH